MKQFEQWQDQIARLFPEYRDKYNNGKDRVLSQTITFQVTDACDLACIYCLSGDTLIRMADYSLKPIKDIQLGDKILGFDEYPEKGKQTKVRTSVVEQLFKRKAKAINVKFSNGESLTITKNHKVLTKRNSYNNKYDYCNIGDLKVGNKVFHLPIIDSHLNIQTPVIDDDYKIGYLIAMIQGDGSLKHYNRKNDGCDVFKFRIAVKDIEIINRCKQFLDDFNIPTYIKPFKVSTKYNLWQDAIFANTRYVYNTLNHLIDTNFHKNFSLSYYQGYLAGFYDAEGHISNERTIRICNTNFDIIQEAMIGLDLLQIPYILELDKKGTKNHSVKYNIRIVDNLNAISSYRFIKSISPSLPRKSFEKFLNYSPLKKTEIVSIEELDEEIDVYNIGTSTHTYIANSIAVHNCYQIHKGKRSMSFETAKKYIDLIISGEKGFHDYINPQTSPGIIIEFIGGEPFLEIDLIDKICDYFTSQLIEKQHPWATKYMFSICSNGVSYFDERVQRFLRKWNGHISFSVTIDGNKELHDSCRVFPDGSPSYDLAVAAAKDWMSRGYQMGSKITIAPGNVTFFYDAIKHMIELGYTEINANCVYEKGWESKHAIVLYEEMKKVSDYFLEHNLDFDHEYYCSLFNANMFHPKDEDDLQNWCFKAGTQILTPNGNKNIEDLQIGDAVISGSGQIQYVEDVKTRYATETCKVKIAGMEPMYTTPEHPILAKRFLYIGFNGKRHFSEPQWIQAKDLKKSDKIAVYKPSIGSTHIDVYLAYLVGRYIGDGWVSTTGYKLCCSYNEVNELTQILKKANIQFSSDNYRTVKQFNIFKSNTELLSILADAGKYAHGKRIPKVVFSWDKSSICAFLQGLFDADGSLDLKMQKQKFNTVSRTLVHDVSVLLRALGYFPMCYLNQRHGKHIIEGRTVNVRDRYELYYYFDPQRSKRCCIDNNENIIWTTVYSSEPSEPYDVYNLTVSNEHTFVANGVIVHNCGGNGVMLSCDPDGYLFPCIRYMESSLGSDQEPYSIGHVDIGICQTECDKCRVECLKKINRRTQSTDECFNCPIAEGCSWCFKAGTLITTPDGFKEIQDIKVGDKVITGSGNIETVEKINSRYTDDTVLINATGLLPLYTTSEHPFWVRQYDVKTNVYQSPKWVSAREIQVNDQLAVLVQSNIYQKITLNCTNNDIAYYHGQPIMWVNVKEVNFNIDGYTVYNMSVSNEHTYLANGAIVHNCTAYNYQVFGTPDARATYICIMHKARALGNIYFWNKYYRKHRRKERMKVYIPDEWALEIINQKELDMLKDLAKED